MTRRISDTAARDLLKFRSAEPPPFAPPSSRDSRIDPWRSATAFVSLIAIGATLGATIAPVLLAVVGRIVDGPGGFPYVWDAFWFASILGAFLGGVLAPLTGFVVLRRVAIGKALAVTAAGTTAGATVGVLATEQSLGWTIGGAVIGYALSAAALHWRASRRRVSVGGD